MMNINELRKELAHMQELKETTNMRALSLTRYSEKHFRNLINHGEELSKEAYDSSWAYQQKLWDIKDHAVNRYCLYKMRVEALENLIKYYTISAEEARNEELY